MTNSITIRRRAAQTKFETFIRSEIGPKLSAKVAKSAHADGISFERKWRAIVNMGMALR
jgi:hypothetical protein